MSNSAVSALAWTAVAAHLVAGALAWRRGSALPIIPIVNLATAVCLVAYAAVDWFAVLTKGTTWYASDQVLPAYAILIAVFACLTLSGKLSAAPWHWAVFAMHLTVLVAAALFLTFFRVNRLT